MKYIKRFIFRIVFCIICFAGLNAYVLYAQDNKPLLFEEKLLSLESCVRFAVRNSFEIELARLDFLIVETDKDSATSVFDSVLSADINYFDDKRASLFTSGATRTRENFYSLKASKKLPTGTGLNLSFSDTRTSSDSGLMLVNPAHITQSSLELRQPLAKNFFGCVDRGNISATVLAIQNADLNEKEKIEDLIARVEAAYWKWVVLEKSLEIRRQILKRAKELHEINRESYDIGNIEKGDFFASQANVLIREKDVRIAEDNFRRAEEDIKFIMNMDASRRVRPLEVLEYETGEINFEDCLSQAFLKRRDYQQAKRDVEIKNIVVRIKKNERWPEIDLVASMDVNGINASFKNAAEKMTSDNNTNYYLGVEISIPLENNLTKSEFEKAVYDKKKTILSLKQMERRIVTEVGNVFRDYSTHKINLTTLREVADLQHEKLKEEEKKFNYGRSNTKRLIDYQQDYLRARLEVALGRFELEVARISLNKAISSILEKYEDIL